MPNEIPWERVYTASGETWNAILRDQSGIIAIMEVFKEWGAWQWHISLIINNTAHYSPGNYPSKGDAQIACTRVLLNLLASLLLRLKTIENLSNNEG